MRLRVATYNIHAGAGTDGAFDLDRQVVQLRALDADVIGLQEVDVHRDARSRWRDLAAEPAQRLRMRGRSLRCTASTRWYRVAPARVRVAVLSRYRILSSENHEITRLSTQDPDPVPAPAPGFGEVALRVQGLPVHVYVTHLDFRPDPSVRIAQVADGVEGGDGRAGPAGRRCGYATRRWPRRLPRTTAPLSRIGCCGVSPSSAG
ncbi:endonuclease/exonuclease/phosphatase family protein [Streptomyces sp. M10(2022)]